MPPGIAVDGIWQHEQTLEDFYLNLIKLPPRNANQLNHVPPQLKNELWKLFGKKRTYIGFGAFLLAQTAMLLLFKFTRWQSDFERMLYGNGYLRLAITFPR